MKERPILFSSPMVLAILECRKTVTRRIVKPRNIKWHRGSSEKDFNSIGAFRNGLAYLKSWPGVSVGIPECPYGQPCDRLWVRETFMIHGGEIAYAATDQPLVGCDKWRPSIFMPRLASRITLEVTGVRVERLKDITDEEALREGVATARQRESTWYEGKAVEFFRDLWNKINGVESWDANPWVWVVEFKKMNSP